MGRYFVSPVPANCSGNNLWRAIYSHIIMNIIIAITFIPPSDTYGSSKHVNIRFIYPNASLTVSDLKNIRGKAISRNVVTHAVSSFSDGSRESVAMTGVVLIFLPRIIFGARTVAWYSPHITKVQSAPGHSPLKMKTT